MLTLKDHTLKKLLFYGLLAFALTACSNKPTTAPQLKTTAQVAAANANLCALEKERILLKAKQYLHAEPKTITADKAERSLGGLHDFYSEGDYWWPDPANPNGPYIRRDGESNPNNFIAHRQAMIRFNDIVASLTSAYILTGDTRYAKQAAAHVKAWFVNPHTKMNPSLLYGQAIKGLYSGRSIGVIDTLHLVEVAKSIPFLIDAAALTPQEQKQVTQWFSTYLNWLNTHEYGLTEKVYPNNHGIAWSLQAAAFAELTQNHEVLDWIRQQVKTVYIKEMMNADGGFTDELSRTKPYGYSLFVLDVLAGVTQIASTQNDNLWTFQLADGRGMKKAVDFMQPYIKNKSSWPYGEDVQYWNEWPAKHASMIFAAQAFDAIASNQPGLKTPDYLSAWQPFTADPSEYEVLRNMPIRHPLLWANKYLGNGSLYTGSCPTNQNVK